MRLNSSYTVDLPAEKYSAAPHGILTLCSSDRIYRVETGHDGQFVFSNVKAGEYALVAAHVYSYAPEQVGSFHLNGNEVLGPLTFLLSVGDRQHPCEVSTYGQNLIRDFDVSYKPGSAIPALIGGSTLRHVGSKRKPLKNAELKLFEAGSSRVLQDTRSDEDGSFHLSPPRAGIYELRMQHQGYHEIQVPPFMVPRENITMVELDAATSGSIVISR
ncbi:MAG: hypothetical protein ACJ746_21465 [Bryobacteraceae bacterium]